MFPVSFTKSGEAQCKNKSARLTYIAIAYPELQSEALKKRVDELVFFLQKNNLKKFPSQEK